MVICIPRLSSRPMPRAAYLPPGGRRADIHPRHPPNQGEGWSLLQRRRTFPSPFAGGAFRREPKRGGMASALCDRLESSEDGAVGGGWGCARHSRQAKGAQQGTVRSHHLFHCRRAAHWRTRRAASHHARRDVGSGADVRAGFGFCRSAPAARGLRRRVLHLAFAKSTMLKLSGS